MVLCLMSQKRGPFYLIIDEGPRFRFLDVTDLVRFQNVATLRYLEGRGSPQSFSRYAKNNWDHFSPYITPSELVRKVEEGCKEMREKKTL